MKKPSEIIYQRFIELMREFPNKDVDNYVANAMQSISEYLDKEYENNYQLTCSKEQKEE